MKEINSFSAKIEVLHNKEIFYMKVSKKIQKINFKIENQTEIMRNLKNLTQKWKNLFSSEISFINIEERFEKIGSKN
jgi:hypothetical protein